MMYIIMFNYSQERLPHRLLMEVNRNEEVPKLVTIHEVSRSKDARNKLLMQARIQTEKNKNHIKNFVVTERKMYSKPQEVREMQQKVIQQSNENAELQQIVKELRNEAQKLRKINESLVARLKQVQSAYRSLSNNLEKACEQKQKQLKIRIYQDVQSYVKAIVQKLTVALKHQRITAGLQNKLQRFSAELMEINPVTVQHFFKINKIGHQREERSPFPQPKETVNNQYVSKNNPKRAEFSPQEQYASIMQRLIGEPRMSKSYVAPGLSYGTALSQDTKFRNVYATTPQKRKRIFE